VCRMCAVIVCAECVLFSLSVLACFGKRLGGKL